MARHFDVREVEWFLPTYQTERVWRNRQRVSLLLPLFASYIFVRIGVRERTRVLQCPGVIRIVGTSREALPVADSVIDFLRSDLGRQIEPFPHLVAGTRVRVKRGAMEGLEGILIRKNDNLRFVLTVELINQHAAVEIDAEHLESLIV